MVGGSIGRAPLMLDVSRRQQAGGCRAAVRRAARCSPDAGQHLVHIVGVEDRVQHHPPCQPAVRSITCGASPASSSALARARPASPLPHDQDPAALHRAVLHPGWPTPTGRQRRSLQDISEPAAGPRTVVRASPLLCLPGSGLPGRRRGAGGDHGWAPLDGGLPAARERRLGDGGVSGEGRRGRRRG
jgi:hypothetical protein